jgi:hypothetical protein
MIKGIPMTLGDGKEYVIPPLTLGALEDHADDISTLDTLAGPEAAKVIVAIVHRALVRNYPKLTIADVRELIDLDSMKDVFAATMGASGMKAKDAGEGEARAISRKPRRR